MAEDLSVFFQDSLITVPVVVGSITTVGILDTEDENVMDGQVSSTKRTVLVRSSLFPTPPVADAAITVDGVAGTVNYYDLKADGKTAIIGFSKT